MGVTNGTARCLGMLWLVYLSGATPAVCGDVIISGSYSRDRQALECRLAGSGLPPVGSIRIILSYDTSRVAIDEALVSSSLQKTALGALVDTTTTTLELTLNTAGTVTIADDEPFAVVQIPLTGSDSDERALVIEDAAVVDVYGDSHEVTVVNGTVHVASWRAPSDVQRDRSALSHRWNLQGRRYPVCLPGCRGAPAVAVVPDDGRGTRALRIGPFGQERTSQCR